MNDVTLTADCTVTWGNLTTGARPRCGAVSGRAAKLTCDRGIVGIIGIISIIGIIGIIGIVVIIGIIGIVGIIVIIGIIGIVGIIDIIDRNDGQRGPHYCSRRTVLFCTIEHGFSHLACV